MVPDRWYRVRIGRVRQWKAERRSASRQETLGRVLAPAVEVPARCRSQDYLEGKVIDREIGKFRCKPSQIFYVVGSWLDSVRYRHQNAQSGVHRGNVICHRTSIVKCKRGQREFVKAQFAPTGDLRGVKLQKPRSRCWGAWSFSTIGITAPIFSKVRVAESVGGATAADSFEKPKCGQEPPSSASPPPES